MRTHFDVSDAGYKADAYTTVDLLRQLSAPWALACIETDRDATVQQQNYCTTPGLWPVTVRSQRVNFVQISCSDDANIDKQYGPGIVII